MAPLTRLASPIGASGLRAVAGANGRYITPGPGLSEAPAGGRVEPRDRMDVAGVGPGPIVGSDNGVTSKGKQKPKIGIGRGDASNINKPKVPAWQDADYNSQMRAIQRALDSYKSRMGLERTQLGGEYAESGRALGEQKDRDLKSMEEDFASRGVINSGVYGTSVGDYNEEWTSQKANLDRQYKNSLDLISQSYQEYLNEVQTQREEARLAAVRRRAQELEANPKKTSSKPKPKTKTSSTSTDQYKPGKKPGKGTSSTSKGR